LKRNLAFIGIVILLIAITNIFKRGEPGGSSVKELTNASETPKEVIEEQREVSSAPQEAPTPPAKKAVNMCEGVEAASIRQLEYIGYVQIEGNAVGNRGWAIKSPRHNSAYYVATNVVGPGIESGEFGVWIIAGTKTRPTMINSVDNTAEIFTPVIPKGRETGFNTSRLDPEIKRLENCAKSQ